MLQTAVEQGVAPVSYTHIERVIITLSIAQLFLSVLTGTWSRHMYQVAKMIILYNIRMHTYIWFVNHTNSVIKLWCNKLRCSINISVLQMFTAE